MTREEFLKLVDETSPTVPFTGETIQIGRSFHRCEDKDFHRLTFGTTIMPCVDQLIASEKLANLPEDEAREIIQTTLNRLVTLREEIHAFIKERLEK